MASQRYDSIVHTHILTELKRILTRVTRLELLQSMLGLTAVRLKVEQNELVGVFGEIGVLVDALKGA